MTALFVLLGWLLSSQARASDPVRRVNQKDSPSNVHCVVWGDGPYFGMKFHDETAAHEQFLKVKRDELIAIHYDKRFREVQRFQSPRVKAVTWHRLADWCKEDHEADAAAGVTPNVDIGVGTTGSMNWVGQSTPASLLERPHVHDDNAGTQLKSDSPALGIRSSSNLVAKVGVIEKELTQIASQTIGLFESIGMKNHVGVFSMRGKDAKKLKTRISVLESYIAGMTRNMTNLEDEFLGASSALATSPMENTVSFKAKVDSMTDNVGSLKKRLAGLDTLLVISKLPKLEERVASYSDKVGIMFKSLGFSDAATRSFTVNKSASFQNRIASVLGGVVIVQRSTKTLGYEVLGHSWDSPKVLQKTKGIKPQLETLTTLVDDLQHRVSELETAPLKSDVDKTEKSLNTVQIKATELSKRIGSEMPSSMLETQTIHEDDSLKARIARLEKLASTTESRYGDLENELLGGRKVSSQHSGPTQSMKDRAEALEVKIDHLAQRAALLEQEV
jgi:hypothetical protein